MGMVYLSKLAMTLRWVGTLVARENHGLSRSIADLIYLPKFLLSAIPGLVENHALSCTSVSCLSMFMC